MYEKINIYRITFWIIFKNYRKPKSLLQLDTEKLNRLLILNNTIPNRENFVKWFLLKCNTI